ncbi:MAG: hypothetical protein R3E39_31050 [Anaerolineae bacterium]
MKHKVGTPTHVVTIDGQAQIWQAADERLESNLRFQGGRGRVKYDP